MPVYIGNTVYDVYKGTVLQDVYAGNVLITGGGGGGTTLEFDDFTVEYEITSAGFVSLSATVTTTGEQALIDTTVTDYPAGHTFMEVGEDTPRPNNIGIIVPVGYSNEGVTVLGQVTANQPAIADPIVVTNNPSSLSFASVTLSGTISSSGDSTITASGFYLRQGNFSTHAEVRLGSNVSNGSTSGTFTSSRAVNESTTYSYYAYATNATGLTGTGDVINFTSPAQPVQQAVAEYVLTRAGQPTGGTAQTPVTGAWSEWTGGTDVMGGNNPTSASCSADSPTCTISRNRNIVTTFLNATQTNVDVCTITTQGAGTPRCSSPDNPVGAQIPAPSTTVTRTETTTEIQTETVSNDNEGEPPGSFEKEDISILSCTATAAGVVTLATSPSGTYTNISSPGTNDGDARNVPITFTWTGSPGPGYANPNTEVTIPNVDAVCAQAAADVTPAFTASSVIVNSTSGTSSFNSNIASGSTVTLPSGVTQFFINNPGYSGGTLTSNPPTNTFVSSFGGYNQLFTWTVGTGSELVTYTVRVRQNF